MTERRRDPRDFLDVCFEAVKAAGSHAVQHKPRRTEIHERFSHDVKLKLDLECQFKATEAIHRHFPGDSILGEEGSHNGNGSDAVEWIVDPIDGTVNFFHGLTWWCSSVAVRVNGRIVAGAVYAPELSMLFTAAENQPARLNGEIIHVSKITKLSEALLVTGSEKELSLESVPLETAQLLAPHVQKIRIFGAAAIDICQVACGAADAFYQAGLYLWDVAAAGLIVKQAGGIYTQGATPILGRYACLACANRDLESSISQIIRPSPTSTQTQPCDQPPPT